jgi:hypothetical protein
MMRSEPELGYDIPLPTKAFSTGPRTDHIPTIEKPYVVLVTQQYRPRDDYFLTGPTSEKFESFNTTRPDTVMI